MNRNASSLVIVGSLLLAVNIAYSSELIGLSSKSKMPAITSSIATRAQANIVEVLRRASQLTAACLFSESRSLLEHSISQFSDANDKRQIYLSCADNDRSWSTNLLAHGQYAAALARLRSVCLIDSMTKSPSAAWDRLGLGELLSLCGDNEEAKIWMRSALQSFESEGNDEGCASALNEIALSNWRRGRYSLALGEVKVGDAHAATLQASGVVPSLLNTRGIVLRSMGEYGAASDSFRNAIRAARLTANWMVAAEAEDNLGATSHSVGLYKDAIDEYQNAVTYWAETRDWQGLAASYNNMGYSMFFDGKVLLARRSVAKALSIWRTLHYVTGIQASLSDLGRIDAERGMNLLALSEIRRSQVLSKSLHDPAGSAICETDQAVVELNSGRPILAASCAGEALMLLRLAPDPYLEARAETVLMRAWGARKQPATASMWGKLAVDTYQAVAQNPSSLSPRDRDAFVKSHVDTYRYLADILIDQGRLSEAERVMLLLKQEEMREYKGQCTSGRTYSGDRDAEILVRAPLPPPLRDARNLSRPGVILSYQADVLKIPGTLAIYLSPLERTEAIRCLSGRNYRSVSSCRVRSNDPSAQFAKSKHQPIIGLRLPSGEARIFTLVMNDRVRIIAITSTGTTVASTNIDQGKISRLVFDFRRDVFGSTTISQASGSKLYDILVPPDVERRLARSNTHEIVWSLDGVLRYLPVAALYHNGHYLVERWSSALALPVSPIPKERLTSGTLIGGSELPWVVTDKVSGNELHFDALPAVREEIATVQSAGPLPSTTLMDQTFTFDALAQGLNGGREIVHVATHFHLVPGDDSLSSMLMGNGELVSVRQIAAMNRPFAGTRLVTLSACSTGESAGDGREIDGLAGVCADQGAHSLVCTLWNVSDTSTASFMMRFYSSASVHQYRIIADSVRSAQMQMLHPGNSCSERPASVADWAPYIVYESRD